MNKFLKMKFFSFLKMFTFKIFVPDNKHLWTKLLSPIPIVPNLYFYPFHPIPFSIFQVP
jgi:hypothetical protein